MLYWCMIQFLESHSILLIIASTLLITVGDSALKKAGELKYPFESYMFFAGLATYVIDAFLWVFILKYIKFSTSGAIYSIMLAVVTVLFGIFLFKENLTKAEYLGLFLAMVSLGLLGRHL